MSLHIKTILTVAATLISSHLFVLQPADFPLGWQQSGGAAQRAGLPAAPQLRRPFLQPVHPRAPGSGAAHLHGEAVHGWKQPGDTHAAEFPTAARQTH